MAKLTVLPFDKHSTPEDVRGCVEKAIASNWPLVALAQNDQGKWELSYFLPPIVSRHEAVGALMQAQDMILYPDEDDG